MVQKVVAVLRDVTGDPAVKFDFFAPHHLLDIHIVTDRETGQPRGFGFVTMSTPEEAQKAIDALNGKELGGRTLNVNEARPRTENRSGGGGGGRSGGGYNRSW